MSLIFSAPEKKVLRLFKICRIGMNEMLCKTSCFPQNEKIFHMESFLLLSTFSSKVFYVVHFECEKPHLKKHFSHSKEKIFHSSFFLPFPAYFLIFPKGLGKKTPFLPPPHWALISLIVCYVYKLFKLVCHLS